MILKNIYKTSLILLILVSIQSIAQDDQKQGWQKGYIVMRTSGDTIYGMANEPRIKTEGDWLNFYTVNIDETKKYKAADITAFKYNDTEYKYFKYSGWSKLIQKGIINIYTGQVFIHVGTGMYASSNLKLECLVFKKGIQDAKFIGADEAKGIKSAFSNRNQGVLKQKAKDYFAEYISDNPEILKELYDENFRYENLINLIEKYNLQTKTN